MKTSKIDWSMSFEDIWAEIEKQRKQKILNDIKAIDEFISKLQTEDIFDHNVFRILRPNFGTQFVWASKVGVTQATIGNYERNRTYPSQEIRQKFIDAAQVLRQQKADYLNFKKDGDTDIDPISAKKTLENSILQAALTDFDFDPEEQCIIAVPFSEDLVSSNIAAIETAKKDLIESLAEQAATLSTHIREGANINVNRVVDTLEKYATECNENRPNPRKMFRWGSNLSRFSASDEFEYGVNEWDKEAYQGFIEDHQELMRLHYREALARAQQVNATELSEDQALPSAEEFKRVSRIIDDATDDAGQRIFSKDIAILIGDLAREIEEYEHAEVLTSDISRKEIIKKRRIEAIKNGAILIGRFLIFTSFLLVVDPMLVLTTAGSIASIVGLIQSNSSGTLREYYETLRKALPFLPKFPTK